MLPHCLMNEMLEVARSGNMWCGIEAEVDILECTGCLNGGAIGLDLKLQGAVEDVDEVAAKRLPFEVQKQLADLTIVREIEPSHTLKEARRRPSRLAS